MFSLATLLAIRTPFQEERARDETPLREQLAEGFRFLWARPFLRTCALMFTWTNLVFEGIVLAFIVIARRHGLSGAQIGLLITLFGLCSLAGSALSPRLQKLLGMRAIVVGSYWTQLLVAAYVVYPSPYVLLGAFLPSAFFAPTLNAVIIGYRVAVTPDHLTGRVNSVARTIAIFGAPLGSLAAGLLLGSFSARTTMAVFTIMLVLLTAFATLSPSIRDAPSLDELKPVEPMEPAFPELVG